MSLFRRTTPDSTQDGRPTTRAVRRLRHKLDEAHDVHALSADPLLGAVTAERFRASVTRTMWLFLAIGLGFTTTGVHDFLAGTLPITDPLWWGAWLVEPALAGILINLLRWEAQMLAAGVEIASRWTSALKWVLLAATLITNVWSALTPAKGPIKAGNVFLHLLIPLVVFLLAEVMPVMQARCIAARDNALRLVTEQTGPATVEPRDQPTAAPTPISPDLPAASPAAPARLSTLRLPAHMSHKLSARMTELGRPLDADEVRALLNLPAEFAARVADQLAA